MITIQHDTRYARICGGSLCLAMKLGRRAKHGQAILLSLETWRGFGVLVSRRDDRSLVGFGHWQDYDRVQVKLTRMRNENKNENGSVRASAYFVHCSTIAR